MRSGSDLVVVFAVVAIIASLVGLLVAIRISRKAKPLGSLPYRWGLFLGISSTVSGSIGLCFVLASFFQETLSPARSSVLILESVLATVAGLGLCRRRKWGIVVWFVSTSFEVLTQLLRGVYQAVSGHQAPQMFLVGGFAGLIFLLANVGYFKKRWHLMGTEPVAG